MDGRAVARNVFLDGNTRKDSRSVKMEPLVGDLQWGLAITWQSACLGYTHVRRSRECHAARRYGWLGAPTFQGDPAP